MFVSRQHLPTIVRLLLGTIIAGGAALCVGGQALAAERSTGSIGQYSSSSVTESTSSEVTITTSSLVTVSVGGSDSNDGSGTGTYTTSDSTTTTTTDGGNTTTTDTRSSLRHAVALTGANDDSSTTLSDHAAALTGSTSPGTSDDRVATLSAPHEDSGSQVTVTRLAGSVQVGHQFLPIRPVIMAQSEFSSDPLMVLPIAPSHDPGKAPAHPNGLLTELTTLLASTVVPGFATLVSGLAHTDVALDMALLALIVLLADTFVSSYGFWLRRTGYTHAARSDMASGFNVATPLMTSYDLSLSRRRT